MTRRGQVFLRVLHKSDFHYTAVPGSMSWSVEGCQRFKGNLGEYHYVRCIC